MEDHDDGQGLQHTMYEENLLDLVCLVQKIKRMGRPYHSEGNYYMITGKIFSS